MDTIFTKSRPLVFWFQKPTLWWTKSWRWDVPEVFVDWLRHNTAGILEISIRRILCLRDNWWSSAWIGCRYSFSYRERDGCCRWKSITECRITSSWSGGLLCAWKWARIVKIWSRTDLLVLGRKTISSKKYGQKLFLDLFVVFNDRFSGFAAVLLKAVESFHEIVLHEILMKKTNQAFLLLGNSIQGKVVRNGTFLIDWG